MARRRVKTTPVDPPPVSMEDVDYYVRSLVRRGLASPGILDPKPPFQSPSRSRAARQLDRSQPHPKGALLA